MIFKILLYGCIVLSHWPRVARCHSNVPLAIGDSNLARSSMPGLTSVRKHFMDIKDKENDDDDDHGDDDGNDDIDHVKPPVNTIHVPSRDYPKFRNAPQLSTRRFDSVERNVNVNVNHYDPTMMRWTMGKPQQSKRPPSAAKRDDHGKRLNQIYQMLNMIPGSNIDYNLAHPLGYVNVQKGKYAPFTSQMMMLGDSEEPLSNEDDDKRCQSIVHKAAEYLKEVEINLRHLDEDLRSLITESPNLIEDYAGHGSK